MGRLEQASSSIRVAQNAIAELIALSGREQNWDEAMMLIQVGRQLEGLVAGLSGAPAAISGTDLIRTGTANERADESVLYRNGQAAVPISTKNTKKIIYPQFLRDGSTLVKVAWSKSHRGEYEHKAPRKVLAAVLESVVKAGGNGRRFTMEQVLPLPDPERPGADLPEYQAYVCLAWLRQEKLVEQHGRSGYSIAKSIDLLGVAGQCWDRLEGR